MSKPINETIKFLKIRDVISPKRAFEYDAGIDFFVPKFDKKFIKDIKEINPLIFGECVNPDYLEINARVCIASGTLSNPNDTRASIVYDLNDDNDSIIKYDDEKGENYFLLAPHSRAMIPGGIKSRMASPGRALIVNNKSGVATKLGLIFGAAVVDYTYKGEIHISVINTSTKNVRIYENMKIIQFIETPVFTSPVEIFDIKDKPQAEKTFFKGLQDDRGEGGFGSTNNK